MTLDEIPDWMEPFDPIEEAPAGQGVDCDGSDDDDCR